MSASLLLTQPEPLETHISKWHIASEAARPAHTAVSVVVVGNSAWTTVEEATLRVRPFSDAPFAYLASAGDSICSTVGAFHVEGLGVQLFARIEGCHSANVGLPLIPLLAELRRRSLSLTPSPPACLGRRGACWPMSTKSPSWLRRAPGWCAPPNCSP
jgi:predicted house-cleaning NTP pyrophosphatase (Maf/HAM1 superfamily)